MKEIIVDAEDVKDFSEVVKIEEAVNVETARALSDGEGESK